MCVHSTGAVGINVNMCGTITAGSAHALVCAQFVVLCLYIFDAGGSVLGCMCVYAHTHTHTHTAHGVLDVSPGVGTRQLEGPKNPDGLNLDKHVFVYVYKVHMCNYML